jgi:hypothetical protein
MGLLFAAIATRYLVVQYNTALAELHTKMHNAVYRLLYLKHTKHSVPARDRVITVACSALLVCRSLGSMPAVVSVGSCLR